MCPAMEAGRSSCPAGEGSDNGHKKQMEGVSKATEGFPVTVNSCHLCSHLNLHIICSKSKGMKTFRYTSYDTRNVKNLNVKYINLNLIK